MNKKLNNTTLLKADISILVALAETIIKSMIDNNGFYNEKQYGSIDNYKTWSKTKLIDWLGQFNLTVGNQINKNSNAIKEQSEKEQLDKDKEQLTKEKQQFDKDKEDLEKERQELEKLKKELEQAKKQLQKE